MGNLTALWKLISKIGGKRSNLKQGLQDPQGVPCSTTEMEAAEVQRYMAATFGAVRVPEGYERNIGEDFGSEEEIDLEEPTEKEITMENVKAMMRSIKVRKAVPVWSLPTAAWLLAENQTEEHRVQLWKTIGRHRRLPTNWDYMQTVWLPKPGKDTSQLRNKRSINLSEPALKGYLNFIQTHVRSARLGA